MTWFRLDTEAERRKFASSRSASERYKHHASPTILRATFAGIRLYTKSGSLNNPTGTPSLICDKLCTLPTSPLAQCRGFLVLLLVVV
tara:strand:+ start:363 stop:623 length:261 start_codon:yes stop_codon:yes gene_type:complete